MSFTNFLDFGDFSEWAAGIFLVLFLAFYTVYCPWWKHPVGWIVNIFVVGIELILGPSLADLADPSGFANFAGTRWYQVLETFNVTFLAAAGVAGILVWRRMHKHKRLPGEVKNGNS